MKLISTKKLAQRSKKSKMCGIDISEKLKNKMVKLGAIMGLMYPNVAQLQALAAHRKMKKYDNFRGKHLLMHDVSMNTEMFLDRLF